MLEENAVSCWIDRKSIPGSRDYAIEIPNAIRVCRFFLLVLSENAQNATFVAKETDLALSYKKMIIPFHVDDSLLHDAFKFRLSNIQIIEAYKREADAYCELMEALSEPSIHIENMFWNSDNIHETLWEGSRKWFWKTKQPGARFSTLSVCEHIMPSTMEERPKGITLPIQVSEEQKGTVHRPLMDVISNATDSLYLIGEGGIGKTTALVKLMENAYGEKADRKYDQSSVLFVPLFIELSRAPDCYGEVYKSGRSSFIHRAVCHLIMETTDNSVFYLEQNLDEPCRMLDELFNTTMPGTPKYLLLLDGLNEVSRIEVGKDDKNKHMVLSMILMEISELAKCSNIRIILTSRTMETGVQGSFSKQFLCGLEDNIIRTFLNDNSPDKMHALDRNRALLETLRIPLFLIMYSALNETSEKALATQGEIFRQFFHERQQSLDGYTTQGRIARVEADIRNSGTAWGGFFSKEMQWFLIDFLLPEIGWWMERADRFQMEAEQLAEAIYPVLRNTAPYDICGKYGRYCFSRYRNGSSSRIHVYKYAKDILGLSSDKEELIENIMDCCVLSLGILQMDDTGKYSFCHHYVRDYFAAVRSINKMRLAQAIRMDDENPDSMELAFACLADQKELPISNEVSRLMGEILGEHWNVPFFEDGRWWTSEPSWGDTGDRSLISRTLDLYRGRFYGEDDYGVYNLIEALKQSRKDLSGMNLGNLDLSQCILNGIVLGKNSTQKDMGANLKGSKINHSTLFPMGHTDSVDFVAFSPDGRYVVSASRDRSARIWNATTGQCILILNGHESWLTSSVFSPDGKSVLTASWDHTARIWNAETGECVRILYGHNTGISSAYYSPDGRLIVTASENRDGRIWDVETGECLHILHKYGCGVRYVNFSLDGNYVFTASENHTVCVWNTFSGELEIMLVISGCEAYIIKGNTGKCRMILEGENHINHAAYSRNGDKIAAAVTTDNGIRIWNSVTGQCKVTISGCFNKVRSGKFSPDGEYFVTALRDNTARVWRAKNPICIMTLKGHNDQVESSQFSPDGKYIVTASWEQTARVWDSHSGICKLVLSGHSGMVVEAFYNRDGRLIITKEHIGIARVWDAQTGDCVMVFLGHDGPAAESCAIYNPDGTHIITALRDRTARIWDCATGQGCLTLSGDSNVSYVAISADGEKVATALNGGTCQVWDYNTGKQLQSFYVSPYVYSVDFSPDGMYLLLTIKLFESGIPRPVNA